MAGIFLALPALAQERRLPKTDGATFLLMKANLSPDLRFELFYDHKREGATDLCREAQRMVRKNVAEHEVKIATHYANCDGPNSVTQKFTPDTPNPAINVVLKILSGQRMLMMPFNMKPFVPNQDPDMRMLMVAYPDKPGPAKLYFEAGGDSHKMNVMAVEWEPIGFSEAEKQFGCGNFDPTSNKTSSAPCVPNQ